MDLETYGWIYGSGVAFSGALQATMHGIDYTLAHARSEVGGWKNDQKPLDWRRFIALALIWPFVAWAAAVAVGLSPLAVKRAKAEDAERRLAMKDEEGPTQEPAAAQVRSFLAKNLSTTKSP